MNWKIDKDDIVPIIGQNEIAIQLRYCFYLEESEDLYDKYFVEKLKIKNSSKLKKDNELTHDDFEGTGIFENTPLHNHFIKLPYNVSEEFINNIGAQLFMIISNYYNLGYYSSGEPIYIPNNTPIYDIYSVEKEVELLKNIEKIKLYGSN